MAASTQSVRPVEARLLVDSALVGYLVGRGGSTIKDTMARSGAGVRVLPKPELPPCACVGDEVVRVCGSAGAVGAALRLLAGQVKNHPLRLGSLPYAAPGGGHAAPLMLAQATHADLAYMHPSLGGYFTHAAAVPGAGGMVGAPVGSAGGFGGSQVEVTFRLLAPVNRTGNIIGKGGEHVRRVRQETGARIKVGAGPLAFLVLLGPLGGALVAARQAGAAGLQGGGSGLLLCQGPLRRRLFERGDFLSQAAACPWPCALPGHLLARQHLGCGYSVPPLGCYVPCQACSNKRW